MRITGLVLAALGATALGCKATVDTGGFEKTLDARIRSLGLTPDKVSCPSGIEAKVGAVFTCQVVIEKTSYDVQATITTVDKAKKDVQLDMQWARGQAAITKKVVALVPDELGKALGAPVAVDCGTEPLMFVDKGQARCKLTAGTQSVTLVLKFDDNNAVTGWELEPALLSKKTLEEAITESVRAQTAPNVTVSCGADLLFPRPADGFVPCEVSDGTTTKKIRIVVSPELKIEKWEAVP